MVPKLVMLGQTKLILMKLGVPNTYAQDLWVPLTPRNDCPSPMVHVMSLVASCSLTDGPVELKRNIRDEAPAVARRAGMRQSLIADVQPATRKQVLECPSPRHPPLYRGITCIRLDSDALLSQRYRLTWN